MDIPPRKSSRRRRILAGVVVAVAIAVALIGLALFASWTPLSHSTCQTGGIEAEFTNYIPSVLVNSPYGGQAWGNGTFPITFPGVWNGSPPRGVSNASLGVAAANGAANGAFFTVKESFEYVSNVTEWGPGTNVRCSEPFSVVLGAPAVYYEAEGGILGPANTSDANEPAYALIGEGTPSQGQTLDFDNGFSGANVPDISTCGKGAQFVPPVLSGYLSVWIPVPNQGHNVAIPYVIPVEESYHYWFPANFGTWQVDNLSAPGGPGGGWAFNFLGSCS